MTEVTQNTAACLPAQKIGPAAYLERCPWLLPLLVAVTAFCAYANSFPGTFILDDVFIAQKNPLVLNPDLWQIFRSDYWHTVENSGLYRPLTILSLALNRMLLGEAIWAYHLVNVLLHCAVAVLLLQALRRWQLPAGAACAAALLFAVHPLHVDVVNTVVGRSELLVALFLLAGFVAARGGRAWHGLLTCLCYLAALLSKEHAITFLALLPIWDCFDQGVSCWRRRWKLYLGLLAVALLWLFWRRYGVVNDLPRFEVTEAASPLAHVDGTTRVLTALLYQGLYLAKLVVPFGLQAVYSVADLPAFIRSVFSPGGLLVVSAAGGLAGTLVMGWRRRSLLALFTILYLVSFSPTANLFLPIGVTFAERLAYFPSAWFCAGAGVLFAAVLQKVHPLRTWVLAGGICLLVLLGGRLLLRNLDYADNLRLWSAEVMSNPQDFMGWQTLGETFNSLGQYQEAEQAFAIMLDLAPNYPAGLRTVTSYYNEREMYAKAQPSAAKAFALSQASGDMMRIAFDGLDLADIALGLGRCGESLLLLDGPVLPLKDQLRAMEIRGGALMCLDRTEEAVMTFSRITEDLPGHRVRYLHGLGLQRLGRLQEAREQLEKAVIQSGDAEAWNLLGVICAQLADWPAAIAALERAVELAPAHQHYRDNLARARRDAS